MTQKELLYLEDAYKHEENTVCIVNQIIDMLEDEDLVSFFEKEVSVHENIMKKLLGLLEECSNE